MIWGQFDVRRLHRLRTDRILLCIESDHFGVSGGELISELFFGDHTTNISVSQHETQTLAWMRQVHRQIRGAAFPDGKCGDDKLRRTFESGSYDRSRSDRKS